MKGEGWGVGGGGGAVDERYVTLGGVYHPALRSVTRGCQVFRKKALRNT